MLTSAECKVIILFTLNVAGALLFIIITPSLKASHYIYQLIKLYTKAVTDYYSFIQININIAAILQAELNALVEIKEKETE